MVLSLIKNFFDFILKQLPVKNIDHRISSFQGLYLKRSNIKNKELKKHKILNNRMIINSLKLEQKNAIKTLVLNDQNKIKLTE